MSFAAAAERFRTFPRSLRAGAGSKKARSPFASLDRRARRDDHHDDGGMHALRPFVPSTNVVLDEQFASFSDERFVLQSDFVPHTRKQ